MNKIDINLFIPPINLLDREGFSNTGLIDNLDEIEKQALEGELIFRLQNDTIPDIMMIEALAYLKSVKSISLFKQILDNITNPISKIRIALSIYLLNNDRQMIEFAWATFKALDDKYSLIFAFHYLIKFNDKTINNHIKHYTTHSDFLISYNAKSALGIKKN